MTIFTPALGHFETHRPLTLLLSFSIKRSHLNIYILTNIQLNRNHFAKLNAHVQCQSVFYDEIKGTLISRCQITKRLICSFKQDFPCYRKKRWCLWDNPAFITKFSCMFSVLPCVAVYCEFKQFWLPFLFRPAVIFVAYFKFVTLGNSFFTWSLNERIWACKKLPSPPFLVNFREKVNMKNKDVEYFAFLCSMTLSNIGSKNKIFHLNLQILINIQLMLKNVLLFSNYAVVTK